MNSFITNKLTTLDIVVGLVCLTCVSFAFIRRGRKPLPPGPRGLPLVGNMFQMPKKEEWKTYMEWAKKYGPITYLNVFGSKIIILNTWKAARDLLDNRSTNYSNRPPSVWNDLCQITWILSLTNGEAHRVRRALVQRYISGPAAVKHQIHQQEEARILLSNVLMKAEVPLEDHLKHYAASSILLGAYGYRVSGAHDVLVKELDRSFEYFMTGPTVATVLLDMFPSLKNYPRWLPLSGFRRSADIVKQVFAEVRIGPYQRSRRMMENSTAKACFISTSIDELEAETSLTPEESAQKEDLIIDCASVMYGAGVGSTVAALGTFFAFMAMNQNVLEKAQAEIDSVTNGERLPTFEDKEHLPYINAIFLEVLRHNSVTPLGLPHHVMKDDIYNDYLIPGGAMILGNMWYIFRDPDIFEDPETFKPERFLDGERGERCREV